MPNHLRTIAAHLPHYLIALAYLWGVVVMNKRLASIEQSLRAISNSSESISGEIHNLPPVEGSFPLILRAHIPLK
jgi:hypothetical protein